MRASGWKEVCSVGRHCRTHGKRTRRRRSPPACAPPPPASSLWHTPRETGPSTSCGALQSKVDLSRALARHGRSDSAYLITYCVAVLVSAVRLLLLIQPHTVAAGQADASPTGYPCGVQEHHWCIACSSYTPLCVCSASSKCRQDLSWANSARGLGITLSPAMRKTTHCARIWASVSRSPEVLSSEAASRCMRLRSCGTAAL